MNQHRLLVWLYLETITFYVSASLNLMNKRHLFQFSISLVYRTLKDLCFRFDFKICNFRYFKFFIDWLHAVKLLLYFLGPGRRRQSFQGRRQSGYGRRCRPRPQSPVTNRGLTWARKQRDRKRSREESLDENERSVFEPRTNRPSLDTAEVFKKFVQLRTPMADSSDGLKKKVNLGSTMYWLLMLDNGWFMWCLLFWS